MAYERFVNNCIGRPTILKFKSEYELIHGISPIQDPNIVFCNETKTIFEALFEDVKKYYETKPIIIIYDED